MDPLTNTKPKVKICFSCKKEYTGTGRKYCESCKYKSYDLLQRALPSVKFRTRNKTFSLLSEAGKEESINAFALEMLKYEDKEALRLLEQRRKLRGFRIKKNQHGVVNNG